MMSVVNTLIAVTSTTINPTAKPTDAYGLAHLDALTKRSATISSAPLSARPS